jgi:hypothetical protein
MRRLVLANAFVLVLGAVGSTANAAPIIEFVATDLADVVPGEDLWQYEYFVSGWLFQPNQGFSVYFDQGLYTNLQSPPSFVNADWDPISIQPDPVLTSDGFYDALALVPNASLASAFMLNFAWLGGPAATPGSQAFTLNEFDAAGNLSFLFAGQTIPRAAVPEPSTLLLMSSVAALALLRRRHFRP